MNARRWIGLVLACALWTPAPTAGAVGREFWHAQAVTESQAGLSVTYFWSRGRSLRAMTVVKGRPIITFVHRDWYYVVDEITGIGLAIHRSTRALEEDASGERPFAQEALLIKRQGAEVVRTGTYHGTPVTVYRLTDEAARRDVWTPADDPDVPLKVEIFDRRVGDKRVIEYVGWDRSLEMPERFFRPDSRIHLERLTYEQYLQNTAESPFPLPILYGGLLHGVSREGG